MFIHGSGQEGKFCDSTATPLSSLNFLIITCQNVIKTFFNDLSDNSDPS